MNKDIGFVTFAQNTKEVNYLELAYLQAMNCKKTNPTFGYTVIVDNPTKDFIEEKHLKVFDQIIHQPLDLDWPMANEWKVYYFTPYYETIKIESDLLFSKSIDHWLKLLRSKDIVLATGCKDYFGNDSKQRFYRKFIDDNLLPDIYNGLIYFRKTPQAQQFFDLAKTVCQNWDYLKSNVLINCREDSPSTDHYYAVTADLYGRENCTIPTADFFKFVHMKTRIQNWNVDENWSDSIFTEIDEDILRINNLNQYNPVHYYDKTIAKNLIDYYEQRI